jgi:hypothetical protein
MTSEDDVQLIDDQSESFEVSSEVGGALDPVCLLDMECEDEPLNEYQQAYYNNALKEHNDVKYKLKDLLGDGAKSIFSGDIFSAYEILGPTPGIENISKPISAFNKKEPKPVHSKSKGPKRSAEVFESEEEDDVPLAKRKATTEKHKKKDKKQKCKCYAKVF